MKKILWWIVGILGLASMVVGVYFLYRPLFNGNDHDHGHDDEQQAEIENAAPDFTVVDKNGNKVSLSEMRGKPVVVNFWATWCSYCLAEMPDLEEAYLEHGDDVVFMIVNATRGDETVAKASEYIAESGYTFPVYYDTQLSAAGAYGLSSLPYTYFINADGSLAYTHRGMISPDVLEENVQKIKK